MNQITSKKPSNIRKSKYNRAASKGPRRRKFVYNNKQITDILASPLKLVIHGYGVNNLYYVRGQKINDFVEGTATGTVVETTGGDLRTLGCLPGRQVYYEDVALKFKDPTTSNGTTNGCAWTTTVDNLMVRAQYEGRTFQSHNTQTSLGFSSDESKLLNRFIYHGGCVIHKFTNTTNTTTYMEFREFTPRQIFPQYTYLEGSVTNAKNDGLYRTIEKDLTVQNVASLFLPTPTGTTFNQFDDKGFKYNSKCLLTNSRWVVGSPITVKVQPGETYTYKMVLPPFQFKTSEFMLLLNSGTTSMNGSDTTPVYVPGFTKHLMMRAWGESNVYSVSDKWNDASATTDTLLDPMPTDNLNNSEAPVQQLDRVTSAGVRLAHTRSEYHTYRGVPYNPNGLARQVRDFRDFAETKFVPGTDPVMYSVNSQDAQVPDTNETPQTDLDQTAMST